MTRYYETKRNYQIFRKVSVVFHFIVTIMKTNEKQDRFRLSTTDGLKPLIYLNYFLGVSPFYINNAGYLIFPNNCFTRCRAIITAGCVAISGLVSIYHMIDTFLVDDDDSSRFNKMIDLTSRLLSNLCPLMLIGIGVFKTDKFLHLLRELRGFNEEFSSFLDSAKVKRISTRVFFIHSIIITASISILLGRTIFMREDSTEHFWMGFWNDKTLQGRTTAIILIILVLSLVALKYTAVAYLECFCIAIATSFSSVVENITELISTNMTSSEKGN